MDQPPQDQSSTDPWNEKRAIEFAFEEYQLLVENTAKVSDNRQALSSLYISVVNLGFLTGAGYLLLQYFQNAVTLEILTGGLLIIAAVITAINKTWLTLSEQNRRLLNLRIRYLTQLEKHLAECGVFPPVDIRLRPDEIRKDGKDIYSGRGTYTIEEILYHPDVKRAAFGFSDAEVWIGRIFTLTYWVAFLFAAITYAVNMWPQLLSLLNQYGIHL